MPDPQERSDQAVAVGAQVTARRRLLRLSQSDVAALAQVSERFVHAVEHGKQTVQLDKLVAVLDAIGLHLRLHRGGAPWIVVRPPDGPSAS